MAARVAPCVRSTDVSCSVDSYASIAECDGSVADALKAAAVDNMRTALLAFQEQFDDPRERKITLLVTPRVRWCLVEPVPSCCIAHNLGCRTRARNTTCLWWWKLWHTSHTQQHLCLVNLARTQLSRTPHGSSTS